MHDFVNKQHKIVHIFYEDYQVFLDQRRRLMAQKIKNYYNQL